MRTAKEEPEYPLLTSDELGELLSRHLEKVALAKSSELLCNAASPIPAGPAIR
jgi:hypothetical protein